MMRLPDLRGILAPRLSGAPLSANEVDYDDLVIHRTYRSYDPKTPGEVRYFMYELSQKNPGEDHYTFFFKAIRLARVTRVPRYLRLSAGSGPNMVFEQQRDVLAALRERQILFLNIIAKSDTLPLIFAYGVQGIGATPEDAQRQADEGWAVLSAQLEGQFQQLEYQQLTLEEGESLMRYQSEWGQIAMARGRPVPAGGNFSSANLLDSNRTEVESSLNQLESFLRGMATREFILSLVTVPVSPTEMTLAWRNISQRLSQVRSEQQGTRSFMAGMAVPLTMGASLGHTSGDGTTLGATAGTGQNAAISHVDTNSTGQSLASSHAASQSLSAGHTLGQSTTQGQSTTLGKNISSTAATSTGAAASLTNSQSQAQSASATDSTGTAQSLAATLGQSTSATLGATTGLSHTGTLSTGESIAAGASTSTSLANALSSSLGHNVGGGIPGVLSGGSSNGSGQTASSGQSAGNSSTIGLNGSTSTATGLSNSQSQTLGQSDSLANTQSVSANQTQALGISDTSSAATALGQTLSSGTSQGVSSGASLAQGASNAQGVSAAQSTTQGVSNTQSLTSGASTGQSIADGTTTGTATSQGIANAFATSYGSTVATSAGIGVIPSVGMSISKMVFDESKRILGDQLDAQMQRYLEGVEGGAWLYQMFLVTPDKETLLAAAGLLKSAFWGMAAAGKRLPHPFHTITDFSAPEAQRLHIHNQAFTSYRRRNPVIEQIEPYLYSSYITPAEMAAFSHPPTNENPGIMGVIDSMPIMPMPINRGDRDIRLGWIINGERSRVSDIPFGIDLSEITHTLIAGTTGIGKTTTLMTMLTEIAKVERTITERPSIANPNPKARTVRAGILALDWTSNMRDLAGVVDPERFSFYSIANPLLGAFRWNPLAVPDESMNIVKWAEDTADNMTISFNLGEFGRSIIAELIAQLYAANRLVPYEMLPEIRDRDSGRIEREAVYLPAVDRDTLPEGAIAHTADGTEVASVLTCTALSRLISMSDLATLVSAQVEEAATVEGARIHGQAYRDRIQSLWRRVMYFAPNSMYSKIFSCDPSLEERTTLSVSDLIDPEIGRVTVIEADGLDLTNRRFILGSVLLAVWGYGQFKGQGVFDQNGEGPGTFVCLEEAHEIFGDQGRDEDNFSASTRTALYESMFRRARALGMKLIAVVQNAGSIPDSITSNTTTVFIHRQQADADRDRAFSLLNWTRSLGQQLREYRYLGEMPTGYAIVRLDAKKSYLESAPVQILTEPAGLTKVLDRDLAALAKMKEAQFG
jgi:DNA helicase HerA-like ATPase